MAHNAMVRMIPSHLQQASQSKLVSILCKSHWRGWFRTACVRTAVTTVQCLTPKMQAASACYQMSSQANVVIWLNAGACMPMGARACNAVMRMCHTCLEVVARLVPHVASQ